VVAISQAPSPESSPNSPLPVATMVGHDPTIPVDRSEIRMVCRLKRAPVSLRCGKTGDPSFLFGDRPRVALKITWGYILVLESFEPWALCNPLSARGFTSRVMFKAHCLPPGSLRPNFEVWFAASSPGFMAWWPPPLLSPDPRVRKQKVC